MGRRLKLSFLTGRANSPFFTLQTQKATLGFSPKCDVWLRDSGIPSESIVLQQEGSEFVLRCSDAQAVVLVNGARMSAVIGEEMLANGTIIDIGKFKIRVDLAPGLPAKPGASNTQVVVEPSVAEGSLMSAPVQTGRMNHITAALNQKHAKKRESKPIAKQVFIVLLLVGGGYFYTQNPDVIKGVVKAVPLEKVSGTIKSAVTAMQIKQTSPAGQPGGAAPAGAPITPGLTVGQILKDGPPKLPPPLPESLEATLRETDATPTPAPTPFRTYGGGAAPKR